MFGSASGVPALGVRWPDGPEPKLMLKNSKYCRVDKSNGVDLAREKLKKTSSRKLERKKRLQERRYSEELHNAGKANFEKPKKVSKDLEIRGCRELEEVRGWRPWRGSKRQ